MLTAYFQVVFASVITSRTPSKGVADYVGASIYLCVQSFLPNKISPKDTKIFWWNFL